ncbi:beta-propeller fold lactonase family protein, partial [Kitasatospora sp. MBT63]|uniref:beta-propeller fold lactonase family protein n=1 Tax=Kitasatospora sp. MBT63 TaxID=1444768 RepID=UPI001314A608
MNITPPGKYAYVPNFSSKNVSVVDTATNTAIGNPISVPGSPTDAAVSPDGTRVYVTHNSSQGAQGSVSIISTATNSVIGTPITVGKGASSVTFSGNGDAYITNNSENTVSKISWATKSVTQITVGSAPVDIAIDRLGRAYVANSSDNSISIIDTPSNIVIGTIGDIEGRPFGLALSPAGNNLYVAMPIGAKAPGVAVIDLADTSARTYIPTGAGGLPVKLAVAPDGSRIFVANASSGANNPGSIKVIDTSRIANPQTAVIATIDKGVGSDLHDITISPDGSYIYVAGTASTISAISTEISAVSSTISLTAGSAPSGVAVSPNGSRAYVTNSSANNVSVIDTGTNAVIATVPVGSSPIRVAVSADGKRAYVSNHDSNDISVINTTNNTVSPTTIKLGTSPWDVATSPDPLSSTIYVSTDGSPASVLIIDTASNALSTIDFGNSSGLRDLAISPNGNNLFVTDVLKHNVTLISTASKSITKSYSLDGNSSPVGISISPDGNLVYVANLTLPSISVIDTTTTNGNISTIAVGTAPIDVAVSPDGTRIYVTNAGSKSVSVIKSTTNSVTSTITDKIDSPGRIAIGPDGVHAYITNGASSSVSVFAPVSIPVGASPMAVALGVVGESKVSADQGSGQSAAVGGVFGTNLKALVTDSGGNPLEGVEVTFAAPSSGASAVFSDSTKALTDSSGLATSPSLTANSTTGRFQVVAHVKNIDTDAKFDLENVNSDTVTSITPDPGNPATPSVGQPLSYTVNVTSSTGLPPTGIVFFTDSSDSSGSHAGTLAKNSSTGNSSVTFIVNPDVGHHVFTASYGGGPGFTASTSAASDQDVAKADTTTTVTAAP